ncbi:MAG: hypothetical protein AAF206_15330 [Bacteroidota bacterium]
MRPGTLYLVLSLLCLFLLYSAHSMAQNPPSLPTANFENVDKNSRVKNLFIDGYGKRIEAFTVCPEKNCSWGSGSLKKKSGSYVADFQDGFIRRRIILRNLKQNYMDVTVITTYADSDNPRVEKYQFARSRLMRAGGGISDK